jgi:hypothetical protein
MGVQVLITVAFLTPIVHPHLFARDHDHDRYLVMFCAVIPLVWGHMGLNVVNQWTRRAAVTALLYPQATFYNHTAELRQPLPTSSVDHPIHWRLPSWTITPPKPSCSLLLRPRTP